MVSSNQRTNLGRGLAALFGEESEDYASLDRMRATKEVPVGHLHPNARQPRRHFDQSAIGELAESIKQNGIIQPVVVRRHPDRSSEFEIVAGERRWRAAQKAQLHAIPVIIRELSDQQCLEVALVENVQRLDLNPLEEADAYQRLIKEFGYNQENLAKVVGKSRSHVANTLRLLGLPEGVKVLVNEGRLSAGHARAILTAPNPNDAARRVVKEGLSVRQVEELVRSDARPDRKAAKAEAERPKRPGSGIATKDKDPDTAALERDLSTRLGMKVAIDFQGQGGRLTVHYQSVEQLDELLRRLDDSGSAF